LILHSYAKLNLYLEVLNKRKDSYHNLRTIFERINLCDTIILKPRRDKEIKITCNSPDVPQDKTNLAYRSAKLLQDNFNIDRGVDIKIIKRIPAAAGLGGGSSNAATVLMGLGRLWRLNLSKQKLAYFSRKLGSDVPFFIYNIPFAQGSSRGDRISPLTMLNNKRFWHIIVVPKIKVSTPQIYKKWDTYSRLTRGKSSVRLLYLALKKNDLSGLGEVLFNSLEAITTRLYPEVSLVKEEFSRLGLKSILMSGSGPAVFGIVSSRKEAVSLCKQLQGTKQFWSAFVARTI
jgi:4-diphosphocytidyl-2-C-methyl-D-erythritol kinase